MDLRHLRHFITLADEGSFVAAADRLYISQSGLTQSIGRLEENLSVRLFERGRFGARLTPAGELMLPRAKLICSEAKLLEDDVSRAYDRANLKCVLGISPSVNTDLVVAALQRLNDRFPGCSIEVVEDWTPSLLARLQDGEVDLVISSPSPHLAKESIFLVEPLYDQREAIVIGNSHPLAEKSSIALADLQTQTWLIPSEGFGRVTFLRQAFAGAGLPPPPNIIRSNSSSFGIAMLRDGYVVAHAILSVLNRAISSDEYRQLDCPELEVERKVCLTTRRQTRHSEHVRLMLDSLKELAQRPDLR